MRRTPGGSICSDTSHMFDPYSILRPIFKNHTKNKRAESSNSSDFDVVCYTA
jgi:hypothetical protein